MENQNITQLTHNMTKENLIIDLQEINWILKNRKQIMASEYVELGFAKNVLLKKLMRK